MVYDHGEQQALEKKEEIQTTARPMCEGERELVQCLKKCEQELSTVKTAIS